MDMCMSYLLNSSLTSFFFHVEINVDICAHACLSYYVFCTYFVASHFANVIPFFFRRFDHVYIVQRKSVAHLCILVQ